MARKSKAQQLLDAQCAELNALRVHAKTAYFDLSQIPRLAGHDGAAADLPRLAEHVAKATISRWHALSGSLERLADLELKLGPDVLIPCLLGGPMAGSACEGACHLLFELGGFAARTSGLDFADVQAARNEHAFAEVMLETWQRKGVPDWLPQQWNKHTFAGLGEAVDGEIDAAIAHLTQLASRKRGGEPDTQTGHRKKNFSMPDSEKVRDLIRRIGSRLPGENIVDCAREIVGHDETRAANLMRQARNYPGYKNAKARGGK